MTRTVDTVTLIKFFSNPRMHRVMDELYVELVFKMFFDVVDKFPPEHVISKIVRNAYLLHKMFSVDVSKARTLAKNVRLTIEELREGMPLEQ